MAANNPEADAVVMATPVDAVTAHDTCTLEGIRATLDIISYQMDELHNAVGVGTNQRTSVRGLLGKIAGAIDNQNHESGVLWGGSVRTDLCMIEQSVSTLHKAQERTNELLERLVDVMLERDTKRARTT